MILYPCILLHLLLFCAFAVPELAVYTRYLVPQLPAEALWNGGEYLIFELRDCDADWSVFGNIQLDASTSETPTNQLYGWRAAIDSSRLSISPPVLPVGKNLTITLPSLAGFVLKVDSTVTFDPQTCVISRSDPIPAPKTFKILSNRRSGLAQYVAVDELRHEYNIRRRGAQIRVTLTNDVFNGAIPPKISSTQANSLGSISRWQWSIRNNVELTLTLPSDPDYNLNAGESEVLTIDISNMTYLDLPIIPPSFDFSISSIDNVPLAYCRLSTSIVTEEELRTGPVILNITLDPPSMDERFKNGTQYLWQGKLKEKLYFLDEVLVNVTFQTVFVTLIAENFEFDEEKTIDFQPPTTFLFSEEAGCGVLVLTLAPSPGQINVTVQSVTEVLLNEEGITIPCTLVHDVFIEHSVTPVLSVSTIVVDSTKTGGSSVTASQVIHGATHVSFIDNHNVIVRIDPIAEYNIPEGVVEQITVSFTGESFLSGLAANVINGTFNITGIQPWFEVLFNGVPEVRVISLWKEEVNVMFFVHGDLWDPTAGQKWNAHHPLLKGVIKTTYSYDSLSKKDEELKPMFNYSAVVFNGHRAFLPMLSIPSLSINFDDRVYVLEVHALFLGPHLPINSAQFKILRANSTDIVVTFQAPTRLIEPEVRLGFSFNVSITGDVFNNDTVVANFRDIIPVPKVFAPFMHLMESRFMTPYILSCSFPPLEDFDITSIERLVLGPIPDSFFLNTPPTTNTPTYIEIFNAPSPTCWFLNPINISERDIRVGTLNLLFEVRSTVRFVNLYQHCNSSIKMINTRTDLPLHVKFERFSLPPNVDVMEKTAVFRVLANESYDITSEDQVNLVIPGECYTERESCANSLNFTISVLPGLVVLAVNQTPAETDIREKGLNITITVTGELINAISFDLGVVIVQEDAANVGTNFGALLQHFHNITAHLVNTTANSSLSDLATVFKAVVPPFPDYDIASAEIVEFWLPSVLLASKKNPQMVNHIITIRPSSAPLSSNLSLDLNETAIFRGGVTMVFNVSHEAFSAAAAEGFNLTITIFGQDVTNLFSVDTMLPASAISFSANRRSMTVVLKPYDSFDIRETTVFCFTILPNSMVSRLSPTPSSFPVTVRPLPGHLVASGTGLFNGSRSLVLGGLSITLTVENDLFKLGTFSASEICPKELGCSLTEDKIGRRLRIDFDTMPLLVIERNVTYNIHVPAANTKSGEALNNISLFFYVEAGVFGVVKELNGKVFEESFFREGLMAKIELSVQGDRFVSSSESVVKSFARSLTCQPSSDAGSFCARAQNMLLSGQYSFDAPRQKLTIAIQPDEDFDVFKEQTVTIGIDRLAFESGLTAVMLEEQRFKIVPQRGSYFVRCSASSVYAQELGDESPENVLSRTYIEITISLQGERWIENPGSVIVEGFTSSSPLQRENNGFLRWRSQLFLPPKVSANRRVLTIVMRPYQQYSISLSEIITFGVVSQAVLSQAAPFVTSYDNTLTIIASGGVLTVLCPLSYSAADVRDKGINITLDSTSNWDDLFIDSKTIASSISSSSPPGKEPNGFESHREEMLSLTETVEGFTRLTLRILPNSKYSLINQEVLTLSIPEEWTNSKLLLYPSRVKITIVPNLRKVYMVVKNPVASDLLQRLAKFIGTTSDTLIVDSRRDYPESKGAFTELYIALIESSAPGEKTAEENRQFLVGSEKTLLAGCCNISAIYFADAMPSQSDIDRAIGLRRQLSIVERNSSTLWIWLSIGGLILAGLGAAIYYYYFFVTTTYSGLNRNRIVIEEEFEQVKSKPLLVLSSTTPVDSFCSPAGKSSMHRPPDIAVGAMRVNYPLPGGERIDDEFDDNEELPVLGKGGKQRRGRIDVDEMLFIGQPGEIIRKKEKWEIARPPSDEEKVRDTAIYPPQQPNGPRIVRYKVKRDIYVDDL